MTDTSDPAAQPATAPDPNPAPTPPTEVAAAPQSASATASSSPATPSMRSASTRANVEPAPVIETPVDSPADSPAANAEPVAEAASEPAAPAEADAERTTVDHGEWREEGLWAGLPRYACNTCAFDTLHVDDIEAHVREHRTEGPPARIYDARGNLIERPA